jgi:hypothetical protein
MSQIYCDDSVLTTCLDLQNNQTVSINHSSVKQAQRTVGSNGLQNNNRFTQGKADSMKNISTTTTNTVQQTVESHGSQNKQ